MKDIKKWLKILVPVIVALSGIYAASTPNPVDDIVVDQVIQHQEDINKAIDKLPEQL